MTQRLRNALITTPIVDSGDHQQHLEDAMAYKMLINGKLVDGAMTLDVLNPATGGVLATCPRADEAQLDEAVAAAKAAFPAWSALSFSDRRKKLEAIADALESRTNEFAWLLTQEQGKPIAQATGEVIGAIAGMRAFAAAEVETMTVRETDKERIIEQRTPLGVVGAIMPWKFPVLLMVMKTGPALITGNTIVAKPAPTTPLTSLLFAEMVADMLPPGVLNIIVDANDLGALMTKHKDIAKVSFTGSTATRKKVMQSVSSSLKRLTLELGGNDAAIVLDDVDVKAVAPKIFDAAMSNAGQICLATKRVYAHSSIYEELCGELALAAAEAVVDDGLKQGTSIGPIQNKCSTRRSKASSRTRHQRQGYRQRPGVGARRIWYRTHDRARHRRRRAPGPRRAVRGPSCRCYPSRTSRMP
jgi:acyl-CoA reductase-like NAD-dependent aldehyde dehydrogenase